MADKKVTALDAITETTTDDLLYVVDAPGTTPVSKKITFDNLQKSITVVGAAAGVSIPGDIVEASDKAFYFGDSSTNGSWRLIRDGNNLAIQRRETGSWVEKGVFEP